MGFVLWIVYAPNFFLKEKQFSDFEDPDKDVSQILPDQSSPPPHLHQLLTSLHKHLLGFCYIVQRENAMVS